MIEAKNIRKSYSNKVLFDDLNFHIKTGEFVCFCGPSGRGKTTLLNMIGLLEPFDSGELLIDGKTYRTNREKLEFYRKKVGFLFQNFALIGNKTVRENLELIRETDRTDCTIEEALEKVGLSGIVDNSVYSLSGGEQQRVALARLYMKQCEIVLADEPTGSLDSENALRVMGILEDLHKQGKTIILVSHDEKIRQMAERQIEL